MHSCDQKYMNRETNYLQVVDKIGNHENGALLWQL